jgi:hypothetical protein
LLDNIELLFDRSLQLDPLDLLKRHAHASASWRFGQASCRAMRERAG